MNLIDCETLWHFCLCVSIFVIIFHSPRHWKFISGENEMWGILIFIGEKYIKIVKSLSNIEIFKPQWSYTLPWWREELQPKQRELSDFRIKIAILFLPKPKEPRWLSKWPFPCSLWSRIGILTNIPRNGKPSPSRWCTAQIGTSERKYEYFWQQNSSAFTSTSEDILLMSVSIPCNIFAWYFDEFIDNLIYRHNLLCRLSSNCSIREAC